MVRHLKLVLTFVALTGAPTTIASPAAAQENEKSIQVAQASDTHLRRQLNRARGQERGAGCKGLFSRLVRNSSRCRALRGRIKRLESQLARTRAKGGSLSARRAPRSRAASYRSICVRTCDGYYFPLSVTTSKRRLHKDAEKCHGRYDPGQAELFYHRFGDGEVGKAVSLKGVRYADQSYAFAYRQQYDAACVQELVEGRDALMNRVFEALREGTQPTAPYPTFRPSLSSDPETLANRRGALDAGQIEIPRSETDSDPRIVWEHQRISEGNLGPPARVAGYVPPEPRDFRQTLVLRPATAADSSDDH